MGTLAVDNIQHTDGSSAVTLNNATITTGTVGSGVTVEGTLNSNTTFSGDAGQRTAKVWVNFNSVTGAIRDDYNVSSLTDLATGDFEVNFLTPMANASYSAQYSSEIAVTWLDGVDAIYMTGSTVSKVRVIHYENNTGVDTTFNMVTIHGD